MISKMRLILLWRNYWKLLLLLIYLSIPFFHQYVCDLCAESDNKKTYMVYFRWGRVGVKGQSKLDGPFHSWDRAIDIFSNKFLDKTKNFWSDRKEFIPHTKSYTWIEMDYGKDDNDSAVVSVSES